MRMLFEKNRRGAFARTSEEVLVEIFSGFSEEIRRKIPSGIAGESFRSGN